MSVPVGDASVAPTPDGPPGAIVRFHVPRFRKDRVEALERSVLVRISQNVLPCRLHHVQCLYESETFFKMGRKNAFFGDGHQYRDQRFGRKILGDSDSPGRSRSSTALAIVMV